MVILTSSSVKYPKAGARGGAARAEDGGRIGGRGAEDLLVGTREAQRAEGAQVGAFLRGEHGLLEAEVREEFHLAQALACRGLRLGAGSGVGGRGDIARREPGVVVRGADEGVEVDFEGGGHGRGSVIPVEKWAAGDRSGRRVLSAG